MQTDIDNAVSIIPARGGSKEIPRKNLVAFAGKPLVAHSIEASLAATHVSRTIVSTDDEEIAEVALSYGAEVVKRPPELALDTSPTEPCMIHVIEELATSGYEPELVVLLQPTSPFRTGTLIDECVEKLVSSQADSLLTAYVTHNFFWQRNVSGLDATYDPRNRPRRQDLKPRYVENGNVYVTRCESLLREKSRLSGKIEIMVMEQRDSIEIDSHFDLWLAEQIVIYREMKL